jgi:hypothetical protein
MKGGGWKEREGNTSVTVGGWGVELEWTRRQKNLHHNDHMPDNNTKAAMTSSTTKKVDHQNSVRSLSLKRK